MARQKAENPSVFDRIKSGPEQAVRISQALTQRVKELAERYETPLPEAAKKVAELEKKVNTHMKRMGFSL